MQHNDFANLVLEHQGRLRGFIRMLGATPDAVDDLAQDAFVVAYERIETLQHPEEAGPWLRSIARNLVRNELRKSMRRRRIVDIRLTEAMLAESDEPIAMDGDAGGHDEFLDALRQCVDQLPKNGRRLIDGRYRLGHTAQQLAKTTDQTAVAVRQSLTRLRQSLRHCVQTRLGESSV